MKKVILAVLMAVASPAFGEIYSWTDSGGTVHYTNNAEDIPEKYRSKAKVVDLGLKERFENGTTQQKGQEPTGQQPSRQGEPARGGGAPQLEQRAK